MTKSRRKRCRMPPGQNLYLVLTNCENAHIWSALLHHLGRRTPYTSTSFSIATDQSSSYVLQCVQEIVGKVSDVLVFDQGPTGALGFSQQKDSRFFEWVAASAFENDGGIVL